MTAIIGNEKIKLVTIGEHTYQITKLNAFAQMHLARKIAGILGSAQIQNKTPQEILANICACIGNMSDDEIEIFVCKALVNTSRQNENGLGFSPIVNSSMPTLMYDDIGLDDLMKLTMESITFNLGNFFQGHFPLKANDQKQAQN